jgi:hypothetical protein
METGRTGMSKRKGIYASKMKRATHMLFYRRHTKPGVKGWELHKSLGSDYPKVLEILDENLKNLDLQIKTVFEEEKPSSEKPSLEVLDRARFYVTLRGDLTPKEPKMIGWRIDDLAGLAITVAYIISKKGQSPRKDVEKLLSEKLPDWKVGLNIDRYIRYGYLQQDEKEMLYIDWRTRAEVDEKALIDLLLRNEKQENKKPESTSAEEEHPDENEEDEEETT